MDFFTGRVPIAWRNTFQNKKRTITALGGITFSILLIFMQLGLLNGARRTATMLYDFFTCDLVIVSDKYQYLAEADSFDIMRMIQTKVTPGVDEVFKIKINGGAWADTTTGLTCQALIFGIDADSTFIENAALRTGLTALQGDNAVLVDMYSHADYGDKSIGAQPKINDKSVVIAGHFVLGVTLFSDGAVVVDNSMFDRLVPGRSRTVTIGLVRITPGSDPDTVKQSLEQVLPDDVLVFKRDEMIKQEQDYFIAVKPMGIMFQMGVIVAFIVGVVVLFQVLSTDISNRINEFATMKAMGFSHFYIYGIGIRQALIFSTFSYIPALIMSIGIFKVILIAAHLHVAMTMNMALLVLAISICMCTISCVLALQKVRKTDPAELF